MTIVKPMGMVGLLTPSGIASDKTAAPFFKSVATSGRLKALFDFENRRTTLQFAVVLSRCGFAVQVCRLHRQPGAPQRYGSVRLLPARRIRATRPRALLSSHPGRFCPRQSEHWNRADLSLASRCEAHDGDLRPPARSRGPIAGRRKEGLANPIPSHVRYDQQFPFIPHAEGAGGKGRSLSERWQPIRRTRPRSSCRFTRGRWFKRLIIAPRASP